MVQPVLTWNALFLAATIVAAAYLLGSISPSYLVVRRLWGQDIRQLGDGNSGAENVARVDGLKAGIIAAAPDIAKGLAVVVLARGLTSTGLTGPSDFSTSNILPARFLPAQERRV